MILQGCVSYAKHAGKLRTEEELLPQCWEQIGHKHAERRQLIAETCGAISPYLRVYTIFYILFVDEFCNKF